jgi:hypothetical protein
VVEDQILVVEDRYDWDLATGGGKYKGWVVIHPESDLTGLKCERLIISRNIISNEGVCMDWWQKVQDVLLVDDGKVVFV